MIRTLLRWIGKSCISSGTLILHFVAYQLWGTGLAEQRAQDRLRRQFNTPVEASARPPATAPTTEASPTVGGPTTSTSSAPLPAAEDGAAIGLLRIPSIGVDVAIVEGVGVDNLKDGPGHYPKTPYPGQAGNAAIAGHRTTYGAPFYRLDELKPGDDLYVATRASPKPWHYQLVSEHDVPPTDVSVLDPSSDNILTLTTCTPRFTAQKRLIAVFKLIGAVDPRPVATPVTAAPGVSSGPLPGAAPVRVGSLSGQGASTVPAVAWGLVCAAVWLGAWLLGRRGRRWAVYAGATPIFLVCLFFFFENFARFVPANI